MHKKSGQRKGQDLEKRWQHRNKPLSPSHLSPHQLQQKIGNRAVTNLLQAKLTVGQPNDRYEQEADRTAAAIMRMPAPPSHDLEDDEAELQTTPKLQAQGSTIEVPDGFETQLAHHQTSGQPLPTSTRDFMEPRFGASFSHVRIHQTPALADAIHAKAFTHGNHIYFNAGQYNPGTHNGKVLLAHELTHVLQQNSIIHKQDQFDKQRDITYQEWWSQSEVQATYGKLRPLLQTQGYLFIRYVFDRFQEKWDKNKEPGNSTLDKEVAWHIVSPDGQWYWETTKTINNKCNSLASEVFNFTEKSSAKTIDAEFYRRRQLLQRDAGILKGFEVFHQEARGRARELAKTLSYSSWQRMQNDPSFADEVLGNSLKELLGKLVEDILGKTLSTAITIVEILQTLETVYDSNQWEKKPEYRAERIYRYFIWQAAVHLSDRNIQKAHKIFDKLLTQSSRYTEWLDSPELQDLVNWRNKKLERNLTPRERREYSQPQIKPL
jgi:hypothetical protein